MITVKENGIEKNAIILNLKIFKNIKPAIHKKVVESL